jgi:NitT/TauT family transport system substrate-binding protein
MGLFHLSLPAAWGKDLREVRVALSAFQDVNSIYVGIKKGFYEAEGIKLVIQNTDWPGANELLIGDHVDMATSSDADVVLQNSRGIDTTLAFPLFYFAGGGLMFDPRKHSWKTYQLKPEATRQEVNAEIRRILEQAKGARVGVSSGGAEYASFIEMVKIAELQPSDFTIVDLAQEELPPALLAGSVDIMIAGIPQRLAVLKEGYATLLDQSAVPSTVAHAGFAAKRSWVNKNPDLAVRIQKVIFQTLDYIEKNPDECFPIIAEKLAAAGTKVDPAALKNVWNIMEFFPNGKPWYIENVARPTGKFYWESRFKTVISNLQAENRIGQLKVPLPDLNYGLKNVEAIP